MAQAVFRIEGMHCIDCAKTVERAFQGIPGVTQAKVHYLKKVATVDITPDVPADVLVHAVEQVGYHALPVA